MALHSKEKIGGRQQGATVSNMSFIFADQETNISPYLRHREKEKKNATLLKIYRNESKVISEVKVNSESKNWPNNSWWVFKSIKCLSKS